MLMHMHTHTRTHAHTHARTHARTHTRTCRERITGTNCGYFQIGCLILFTVFVVLFLMFIFC